MNRKYRLKKENQVIVDLYSTLTRELSSKVLRSEQIGQILKRKSITVSVPDILTEFEKVCTDGQPLVKVKRGGCKGNSYSIGRSYQECQDLLYQYLNLGESAEAITAMPVVDVADEKKEEAEVNNCLSWPELTGQEKTNILTKTIQLVSELGEVKFGELESALTLVGVDITNIDTEEMLAMPLARVSIKRVEDGVVPAKPANPQKQPKRFHSYSSKEVVDLLKDVIHVLEGDEPSEPGREVLKKYKNLNPQDVLAFGVEALSREYKKKLLSSIEE